MNAMENNRIQVLDHGYIKFIEHWGSDQRIVEAARMSTDKGFQGWGEKPCPHCSVVLLVFGTGCEKCNQTGRVAGDEKLLAYLYKHQHMTPFEMAGLTLEIQAPIFVFREWHRHRTQSYNELSARYTPIPDVNYVPSVERCLAVSASNKQAGAAAGAQSISEPRAAEWLAELILAYKHVQEVYDLGLKMGLPKEVARLPVPVGRYSRMRASANLRNWLAFLTLRMDQSAQWEIRQYANVVGDIVAERFPRVWALFCEGK